MRGLLLCCVVLACSALAPDARAGNGIVTRSADGAEIRVTFTDAIDSLIVNTSGDPATGSILLDENTSNATTLTPAGSTGCTQNADDLSCPRVYDGKAAERLVVEFAGGDDFSEVTALGLAITLVLDGGPGDDTLWGSERGDVLEGDAGHDELHGFRGADRLEGGPGDDDLAGYEDADDYGGGDGIDSAVSMNRDFSGEGITVTLDGMANDGAGDGAEGDNVRSDVEEVHGTQNADRLTGNERSNALIGGGGADRIEGGAGPDVLDGGAGGDVILARDGAPDRISCGPDADALTADSADEWYDCEQADAVAPASAERDGDGDGTPAGDDCDDADPSARPGGTEVSDNGVDEDCRGGDATDLDRDRDGAARPSDCDDADPAVRPGAAEVLGNAEDEDCSGVANPLPRVAATVEKRFWRTGRTVRVRRLALRGLLAGTVVEVRCSGRGCPFRRKKRTVEKAAKRLELLGLLRRARLGQGAVLELRITRPGSTGRVVRFAIARRGMPAADTLCLAPGAREPVPC